MYMPSPGLLIAAEQFLEIALKNERKASKWLIAALKTSNHPILLDGVIVTTNFYDLYAEDDEFKPAPSFNRENYTYLLKQDTKKKSITSSDKMVTSFIDAGRGFRLDVSFHCVLYHDGKDIYAIDVLDTDIESHSVDYKSDDLMCSWFYDRVAEIEGQLDRHRSPVAHLRVVVNNS